MTSESIITKERIEGQLERLFNQAMRFSETDFAANWFIEQTNKLELEELPLLEAFAIEKRIEAMHEQIVSNW